MKNKTIPITLLRDTGAIDELVKNSTEPIIVTKNGYEDFRIIPKNCDSNFSLTILDDQKNYGFYRVKCCSIETVEGDIKKNCELVAERIKKAIKENVDLLSFSELTLVGACCEDLGLVLSNQELISKGIEILLDVTLDSSMIVVVGCILAINNCNKNCAVVLQNGKILCVKIKKELENEPSYNKEIVLCGQNVVASNDMSLKCLNNSQLSIHLEIGNEYLYSFENRKNNTLCVNLGGFPVTNQNYRSLTRTIENISEHNKCAYMYTDCNSVESSAGSLFGNHHCICENGRLLVQNAQFSKNDIIMDIDLELISQTKIHGKLQSSSPELEKTFNQAISKKSKLLRKINPHPFLPDEENGCEFASNTMNIQIQGLMNRMGKIHCKKAVIGLSGGLDSALAFIVTVEAFKRMKYPLKDIYVFSMPCFGTTSRTKNNSSELAKLYGVTFKEINISESVSLHLKDLEVSENNRSTAFENAQARERTQILMDYANLISGIVIGTGDLSELALGWCTFNGDHMAMYGVNAGISKTLVKYLVNAYADENPKVKAVLKDILDTPISPELLPGSKDKIGQLTEDNIGPYELQDFYIYNFLKYKFSPAKLKYLASIAFKGVYDEEVLNKWLIVFLKRFFTSQFKRNTVPDSPKICDIDLSPKTGLQLPSDISYERFLNELEEDE